MTKSTIGLRLSEDTQRRLEALGKARDRTPHYLMRVAVERYLDAEEALEAERQLIEARWEKFALTGEALDHDEVRAWVASLDGASEDESA